MVRQILCAAVALLLMVTGCDKGNGSGAPSAKTPVIAVIPKSVEHVFWKAVETGARQGAAEAKVEIRWQGPNNEADRQAEIRIVADMVAQGVDAVCIAPNDKTALIDSIVDAHKKMPVIVFDSGADTDDYTAFIATDNRKGGEMAGQYMLKLLGDAGGKVAVLRGVAGSQSTTEREEGFIAAIKAANNPKITIVDARGDNELARSKQVTADLLTREGDIAGFFGCSEPASLGVLGGLEDTGKAGKVKFVGFDGGDALARGMDEKKIDALVVQQPVLMGEMAVKAAAAAVRGQKVDKHQPIQPVLITQENKDDPKFRSLLQPKLK
jgi:ribose transport system substrate-binding protein